MDACLSKALTQSVMTLEWGCCQGLTEHTWWWWWGHAHYNEAGDKAVTHTGVGVGSKGPGVLLLQLQQLKWERYRD